MSTPFRPRRLLILLHPEVTGTSPEGKTIGNINPLPDDKFYSSKLKEFADDDFKFDKKGRKLSKRVENTVGKGEIARYEQFLLFPVFSKGLFSRGIKRCH